MKAEREFTLLSLDDRLRAADQPLARGSEGRTDMNKAARLLAALAVMPVTVSGCGDLYCGGPKGDNVNVLGCQDNR
jgi:hypothetical protein